MQVKNILKKPLTKEVDKAVVDVVNVVSQPKVYSATKYLSDKMVIRISRKRYQGKLPASNQNFEAILVIGRPNYAQRKFIKLCKKAKEPFPIKSIQIKLTK